MNKAQFESVVQRAAAEIGVAVAGIDFNDDDNVFVVTIARDGGYVGLEDCEHVHRAVLAAFDRDVEDYSLTVTSAGVDALDADEALRDGFDND